MMDYMAYKSLEDIADVIAESADIVEVIYLSGR